MLPSRSEILAEAISKKIILTAAIELKQLSIWSLNQKVLEILTDDLKATFNLMFLLQLRNISISCLFTWRDIFPKISTDTVISFLVELSLTFFLVINNLCKNFSTHLSMKKNGKEFFCHTDFRNKISWWKLA